VSATNPLTAGLPATEPLTSGAAICAPGYNATGWVDAVAPGTVLGALLDAGKYDGVFAEGPGAGEKDVWYGDNLARIPFTDFQMPWWWRTSFSVPQTEAGKRVTLSIKGLSYTGDIYVNGQQLKNKDINVKEFKELWNQNANAGTSPYAFTALTGTTNNNYSSVTAFPNAVLNGGSTAYIASSAYAANGSLLPPTGLAGNATTGGAAYKDLTERFIGVFRTYDIDITDYILPSGGSGSEGNVIAIAIKRPYYKSDSSDNATTGDFTLYWVDWHPPPPRPSPAGTGRPRRHTRTGRRRRSPPGRAAAAW
jgi:hypothetical protein